MVKICTHITRGEIVESVHYSKCLIKDYNFKTIFSTGHENDLIFPRSAIKIFQAIPFIHSKAHDKFNLNKKQIAISCSSHCGENIHLKVLKDWLNKLKISNKVLKCGVHNPLNPDSSNNLLLSGKIPNQLHNNCAGKHLGMISGSLAYKMNIKNYVNIESPYQKLIRESLEYFTKCKINKYQRGIDGCSAPQYAFPINNLAASMINFLKNLNEKKKYTNEINILANSIARYPELTGSKIIYPCQLMIATNGKIFAKGGAEGVLLFAHKEKKIGGVIKVKDGNERAIPSITNQILKKLKILNRNEYKILSKWSKQKIFNHAKINVGEIYTKLT